MHPQLKIRRHGYHLMSLASVGALGMLLIGVLMALTPWLPDWSPQALSWEIGNMDQESLQGLGASGKWLASLAALVWTLAYLVPLLALRRLGHRLYRNDALSVPVADGFRWLAHSLPLYAVLKLAGTGLATIAEELGPDAERQFTLDVTGSYAFLVACLCLYSVAHVMRLAAATAEDARSIV